MRAVQIVDLTGPESALAEADVPEPEPSHPLTPGSGVLVDSRRGRLVPRSAPDARRGSDQSPTPVRARQRGRRHSAERAGGSGLSEGDRVAACCMLGAFADVAVAPTSSRSGSRTSSTTARRGPDPQLPHRLLLVEAPRPAGGGRNGAGPRRGRRRGHRDAQGGERARRAHDRGGLERRGRSAWRNEAADEVVRSDGAEGRGEGAVRGRGRCGDRPRGRRPLHRQLRSPARAAAWWSSASRAARSPSAGESPAAEQHRGGRRRLGRLRWGSPASTARSGTK